MSTHEQNRRPLPGAPDPDVTARAAIAGVERMHREMAAFGRAAGEVLARLVPRQDTQDDYMPVEER